METTFTHYRTCNLCEAMCGLEINVQDQRIQSIKGDQADPFSKGHICPKALGLKDIYEDPDRLKVPLRRTASGWQEMPWDEALDAVADQLKAIQQKYGDDAIGVYQGNPNVHNMGALLFGPDFIRSLGTKNRFSATSADQLPHHFAALLMFGHYFMIPIPDVDHTDYLLILGANPLVSNGSLMSAPGIADRLRAIRQRGGKVVVVDPRRTETAAKADEHIFIRPGHDPLLLLALIHTLFEEDWVNPGKLVAYTDGLEAVKALAADFAPERVAACLEIEAVAIRRLAREFAGAARAVCYGRIGTSTQAFGGLSTWLITVLNLLTGNLDRVGGAMFTQPAIDTLAVGGKGKMGRWKSRVRGLPEFAGELPVAVLTEEITTPGEGQIRALVTAAGNPVLSTPNGAALDQALRELEFMVSFDIYLNETTRHAQYILPPTTGLETAHYDLAFHLLAVRNTAKYSPPLFPRQADQRHDYEIFQTLTRRMKNADFPHRTPEMMLDLGLRSGPYGKSGMSLNQLQEAVHGVDLGALQPCLPERLFSENKRIDLAPAPLLADVARMKAALLGAGTGDADPQALLLIGRRQLRSNNSWMHNVYRLVKGGDRCTLLIHPDDAIRRNIAEGVKVEVRSRVGSLQITAELSDEMMRGVVSIPHGWGHDHADIRLQTARSHAGVSINDLTDNSLTDELTGNAAFSGVPVQIKPIK